MYSPFNLFDHFHVDHKIEASKVSYDESLLWTIDLERKKNLVDKRWNALVTCGEDQFLFIVTNEKAGEPFLVTVLKLHEEKVAALLRVKNVSGHWSWRVSSYTDVRKEVVSLPYKVVIDSASGGSSGSSGSGGESGGGSSGLATEILTMFICLNKKIVIPGADSETIGAQVTNNTPVLGEKGPQL
jgi:hypothetical protein